MNILSNNFRKMASINKDKKEVIGKRYAGCFISQVVYIWNKPYMYWEGKNGHTGVHI